MTQQEIQERNEEIALMLGYINITQTDKDFHIFEFPTKIGVIPSMIETMSMKFHSDWNWLMEAAKFMLDIVSKNDEMEVWYSFTDNIPDIEICFVIVSDYAKVYNQSK